jgi:hypothetical protein
MQTSQTYNIVGHICTTWDEAYLKRQFELISAAYLMSMGLDVIVCPQIECEYSCTVASFLAWQSGHYDKYLL